MCKKTFRFLSKQHLFRAHCLTLCLILISVTAVKNVHFRGKKREKNWKKVINLLFLRRNLTLLFQHYFFSIMDRSQSFCYKIIESNPRPARDAYFQHKTYERPLSKRSRGVYPYTYWHMPSNFWDWCPLTKLKIFCKSSINILSFVMK